MRIAVDAARFAAAVYDVPGQAAWRVRIGGRYLLAVGGIAPQNGSLDLIEAHAEVVQEHPALADVLLVFADVPESGTDAEGRADFLERAAEVGAVPVLLGPVAEADRPALVAGAAAFVLLPTGEESGVSALEALAAGVPVVARELPELREVLGDLAAYGDTALSIADALLDVLTDPPAPVAGVELAASYADDPSDPGDSEDRVVEQQPDRRDRRQQ